jgi:glucose-1-phosphate adenylyltransferase
MDLKKLFKFHSEKNADITLAYCTGKEPKLQNTAVIDLDSDSKVTTVGIDVKTSADVNYLANVILIRKSLLERLIGDAQSYAYTSFEKDIIQKNVATLNIYGYKVEEWNCTIDSIETFFDANMALLDKKNRKALFNAEYPVYTKVRDDMPVIYGITSNCKNSLVADGCLIEGTVKNCIVFRGARVAKGAVVENSILTQDAFVGEDAKLNCVIMDKNTVITPKKVLSGDKSYPLFVGKKIVI